MLGLGRCQSGEVTIAATSTAAPTVVAVLGNIAAASSLDVVVSNIAAVGSLVPDAVAFDISAGCLAGDGNIGSLLVALDYRVGCSRARAAIDAIAGDGIGSDNRRDGGESQSEKGSEQHFEKMTGIDLERVYKTEAVAVYCRLVMFVL